MARIVSKSSIGFKSRILSTTFQANTTNYKRFTAQVKKRVRQRFAEAMERFAQATVNLSKMMCPVYKGALENSIVMTNPYGFGGAGPKGRIAIQIGVSSDWKSEYDELNPPWGHSSKEIVYTLHEFWEDVAGERAKKRAAEKSSMTGERVGSKFLTRASERVAQDFNRYIHSGKIFEGITGVNPHLAESSKYSGKWKALDLQARYPHLYGDSDE